jgi:hypothetical protein
LLLLNALAEGLYLFSSRNKPHIGICQRLFSGGRVCRLGFGLGSLICIQKLDTNLKDISISPN